MTTGAMRDALELIRSLKDQYPDETEDQLISRCHKELEGDQTLRRALMRDVFTQLASRIRRREAAKLRGPPTSPQMKKAPAEADALSLASSKSRSPGQGKSPGAPGVRVTVVDRFSPE